MKRGVHDQAVKMQMRCDYIIEPTANETRATKDKDGSTLVKYKQMTKEFLNTQKELNLKFAKDYRQAQLEQERNEKVLDRGLLTQKSHLNANRAGYTELDVFSDV